MRLQVGGPDVMRKQLDQLEEEAQRPGVRALRIPQPGLLRRGLRRAPDRDAVYGGPPGDGGICADLRSVFAASR
ncbi:hypothetical protein [Kitasatospora sp. MAP12-44]|uniref:hypothetical protein n=1 Tax=Kitasatospora sp. MAP12-22 TaxID=3156301 RepID=UPI0024742772|nr:hypothetical protein [Kitasatospora sp. MAP12-44]